jgi:uncharacterized protein YcbX
MSDEMTGTVVSLWRYPVKSMMGEELNACETTERGFCGDRAYGLVDGETGKLASAKHPRKWGRLFDFRADFVEPPELDAPAPPVRITFPDGAIVTSEEPGLSRRLSEALGRRVALLASAPAGTSFEEVWPAVKGSRLYGNILPDKEEQDLVTEVPAAFRAPAGTFFDFCAIHLITTNTLDRLRDLAPQHRFEARRFRPNLVVDFPSRRGFVENDWSHRVVTVGEVRLKVIIPTARCVMTTLAQGDLPRDPGVLRAMAEHNRVKAGGLGVLPCAGVYAFVLTPGTIRRGDSVSVE